MAFQPGDRVIVNYLVPPRVGTLLKVVRENAYVKVSSGHKVWSVQFEEPTEVKDFHEYWMTFYKRPVVKNCVKIEDI